jgi:hypothetical protein
MARPPLSAAVGGAGSNDVTPATEGTNDPSEPADATEQAKDASAHSTDAVPNVRAPKKLGELGRLGGPHESACKNSTSGPSDGAHEESKVAAVDTEGSPAARGGNADGAEALRPQPLPPTRTAHADRDGRMAPPEIELKNLSTQEGNMPSTQIGWSQTLNTPENRGRPT